MSKADTSTTYIVAFILGIIVLAIAAYLMYKYVTKSQLNCSQCSAELTAWCVKCYKIYGKTLWGGETSLMDTKLSECVVKCNLLSGPLNSCDNTAFDLCKSYIPLY